jgi:glutaredoxin
MEAIFLYHDGTNAAATAALTTFFEGLKLSFTVVDIREDAAAAENVAKWTDGRAGVFPLVRVGEKIRSLFFNPTPAVLARLFVEGVADAPLASEPLEVFSANWCPDCRVLESALDRKGVSYRKVDIETTPGAPESIMRWSGGRRVVPTVRVGENVVMFNPGPNALARVVGF